MYWFFTGLLILFSAGVVGFGGYLLRRLFTTEPADAAGRTGTDVEQEQAR